MGRANEPWQIICRCSVENHQHHHRRRRLRHHHHHHFHRLSTFELYVSPVFTLLCSLSMMRPRRIITTVLSKMAVVVVVGVVWESGGGQMVFMLVC